MISAIIALALSMVGMILYMMIRFQFSYSIAANVALIHDVIVSMGIYFILGGQFTLQVVASVLTLIGYSVNDTIVTVDRQRENLKLQQGKTYFEIVNMINHLKLTPPLKMEEVPKFLKDLEAKKKNLPKEFAEKEQK